MEEYTRDKSVSDLQTKLKLSQREYENLKTDLEIAQIQLQEANDTLNGGITPRNMANFRNTYVINASDSLDDTHPMYVHFRVLDETVKIVSVKVSYWIDKYRAYSKASASGGSSSPTSAGGGVVSSAGGGVVSSTSSGGSHAHWIDVSLGSGGDKYTLLFDNVTGRLYIDAASVSQDAKTEVQSINHVHVGGSHVHVGGSHVHVVTIEDHTHDAVYGIFEEENTPTIKFSVSQDDGVAYSKEYGNVPIDRELIDITSDITKTGSKILKFESTTRTRLTVQVEVKVDISVR